MFYDSRHGYEFVGKRVPSRHRKMARHWLRQASTRLGQKLIWFALTLGKAGRWKKDRCFQAQRKAAGNKS